MQKLLIKGKKELLGTISISGSKNATLPILAASILAEKVKLTNIPNLSDIRYMIEILKFLGASAEKQNDSEWVIQANLIWCILIGLGINFWGHRIYDTAYHFINRSETILNRTSRRRSGKSQLLSIAYSLASVTMLMAVLIGILLLRDKGIAHYLYFSF